MTQNPPQQQTHAVSSAALAASAAGLACVSFAAGLAVRQLVLKRQQRADLQRPYLGPAGAERERGDGSGIERSVISPSQPAPSTYKRVPLHSLPPLQNDLLLRAARGEATERVPVWIMRQAGRYLPEFRELRKTADFFTMCRTPELACEITLQPLERFKGLLDAVIVFSDILVIPESMGMHLTMVPGVGPVFPSPLKSPADLERLVLSPNIEDTLGYVLDAVNLTRVKVAGRVPVIGFAGAPFTLMAYMVEGKGSKTLSRVKTWLYTYPDASHGLLRALTDVIVEYLVAKVRAGAQVLQVFESNACDMSPAQFDEFSLPYLRAIASRVKHELQSNELPVVPMIVFARGANHEGALEALAATAFDVVGLDWTVDPLVARARVDFSQAAVQGNLDPCVLFAPRDVIIAEVGRMLGGLGTRGVIANLGHGMLPDMDPDHAACFLEAVQTISRDMNLQYAADAAEAGADE